MGGKKRVCQALALSVALVPSWTHASEWTVDRLSGTAWALSSGREPVPLAARMVVSEGNTVATAPNGRVRLSRDGDVITLSPGTTVLVMSGASAGGATRVIQREGTTQVAVSPRAARNFSVETPFLAAVVKGTTFTVSVEGATSTVDVTEGLVEVRDFASGETADVGAGQSASSGPSSSGLSVSGPQAPTVSAGVPQQAAVATIGQAPARAAPTAGLGGFLSNVFGAGTEAPTPAADAASASAPTDARQPADSRSREAPTRASEISADLRGTVSAAPTVETSVGRLAGEAGSSSIGSSLPSAPSAGLGVSVPNPGALSGGGAPFGGGVPAGGVPGLGTPVGGVNPSSQPNDDDDDDDDQAAGTGATAGGGVSVGTTPSSPPAGASGSSGGSSGGSGSSGGNSGGGGFSLGLPGVSINF